MIQKKRARAERSLNLKVLSVASIFAEAMRCNTLGRSVGELFAFWHEEDESPENRPTSECAPGDLFDSYSG